MTSWGSWAKQQYVSAAIRLPNPSNYSQRLANVAGTQEPIYGPSAIQSVAKQAETTPYTELTKEDLKWAALNSTSVETQIFYVMADNGHIASAQVIYSNVAYGTPAFVGSKLLTR